jgi:tetratricopeptide (TPR) repeat protein
VSAPELTRRETDVLVALCRPLRGDDVVAQPASVREIATELVVTEAAVKQHLVHLYDKFGIAEGGERRRVALAREAIRLGIGQSSRPPAETAPLDAALVAGREAYGRNDWERCAALLTVADEVSSLGPADLVLLAEAHLWANRHEATMTAHERAYRRYLQAGDERSAGLVAALIAIHSATRHELAVAGGWLATAQRLLDAHPDSREHGYVVLFLTVASEAGGDWDAVATHARRMLEVGRAHRDADLEVMGLAFEGLVATRRGSIAEGARLLDEAMARTVGGERSMLATGVVYCRLLTNCLALQDYRRAGEWTDVVDRCGHATGMGGFPGDCRAHRASVLMKRGDWAQGEQEALRALEETGRWDLTHSGSMSYELGEMCLHRGDLEGAERAFVRAHQFGFPPRPGLSLVHLARGDVAAATATIDEALAEAGPDPLTRARLLPARARIGLAAGDGEAIAAAARELGDIALRFGTPALAAAAAYAHGAGQLVAGEPAVERLGEARRLYLAAEMPYEAACARELLGDAHLALGRTDVGRLELISACGSFEELGAAGDAGRLERRLAALR